MSDKITILSTSSGSPLAKEWKANGDVVACPIAKYYYHFQKNVDGIKELSELLTGLESKARRAIIRGSYLGDEVARELPEYQENFVLRRKEHYEDNPLHSLLIEVDEYKPLSACPIKDPLASTREYIEQELPSEFHKSSYHWQLSSSAGKVGNENILKAHIWFWLKKAYNSDTLKCWAEQNNISCDKSVLNSVQLHFTANPVFEEGVKDPIKERSGFFKGEVDDVDLNIDISEFEKISKSQNKKKEKSSLNDPLTSSIVKSKYFKSHRSDGAVNIECPFKEDHSIDSTETSTTYFPPNTGGYEMAAFKCFHQSCSDRNTNDFIEMMDLEGTRIFDPRDHLLIARTFTEDNYYFEGIKVLINTQGTWFAYLNNCYVEKAEEQLRKELTEYLDISFRRTQSGISKFLPTNTLLNSIFNNLRSLCFIENLNSPAWIYNKKKDTSDIVSMENGIVDLKTKKLSPLTPELFNVNILPYKYIENSQRPEKFLNFLDEIFAGDNESIETLQEILGYLITNNTSQQKIFMLIGPPRSGKGTLIKIISNLIGINNIASPSLGSLSDNFGLSTLINKKAAIFADVRLSGKSNQQAIIENLLSISGEDMLSVNRKYKDSILVKLTCRLILVSNELPILRDGSSALLKRLILLQTKKSFYGKEDLKLDKKLLDELPEIFTWAISGIERLDKRGYFIQPTSSKEILNEFQNISNPVSIFVEEYCTLDTDGCVEKDILYSNYCSWCQKNGVKQKSKEIFFRNLNSLSIDIKSTKKTINGSRTPVLSGIKMNSSKLIEDLV